MAIISLCKLQAESSNPSTRKGKRKQRGTMRAELSGSQSFGAEAVGLATRGGFTVSAVIMGITSTRPVMMSYPEAGATQISITNITRVISLHFGDLRCLATAKEG